MISIPKIEAQLVELQRNYTNDQSYYQQLIKRRDSAEISKNADEKTDDVKFRILDEPREATIPVGPPRSIFYVVILFIGLSIGVLSAFANVQLKNIISSRFHFRGVSGRTKCHRRDKSFKKKQSKV